MTASDHDIKGAIAEVIAGAAPKAVIFPWWALGRNQAEWAGLLRSPEDDDRAHGWIITRRANQRIGLVGGASEQRRTYYLWLFHYYDTGNAESNSDDLFQAELDAVGDAFADRYGIPALISDHEEFQVPIIDLISSGDELLHVGYGQLILTVC